MLFFRIKIKYIIVATATENQDQDCNGHCIQHVVVKMEEESHVKNVCVYLLNKPINEYMTNVTSTVEYHVPPPHTHIPSFPYYRNHFSEPLKYI